jgi:hypothetical protein
MSNGGSLAADIMMGPWTVCMARARTAQSAKGQKSIGYPGILPRPVVPSPGVEPDAIARLPGN